MDDIKPPAMVWIIYQGSKGHWMKGEEAILCTFHANSVLINSDIVFE